MILPHDRIAIGMYGTFGHIGIVTVLKMNRILEKVRRKKSPLNLKVGNLFRWLLIEGMLAPVALTLL